MADSSNQRGPLAIPVTCKRCGEEFASKTKQYIHSKTCLAYKCEQCDVRCKTKKELEKHIKDTLANVSSATSAPRTSLRL